MATRSRDRVLAARTACCLLERTSNTNGFSASLPLAAQARRFAIRSGDRHVLALLHLVHGRLEARSGRNEISRNAYFALCRELLKDDENLWLDAASHLDESGVLSSEGNLGQALAYAERGIALAHQAGWSKGIVPGAANLAYLFLEAGNVSDATRHLHIAEKQAFSSSSSKCGLTETAAQIAIMRGDFARAEELLRECLRPGEIPTWYALKGAETLVKLPETRTFARSSRSLDAVLSNSRLFEAGSVRGFVSVGEDQRGDAAWARARRWKHSILES